jgi:beta-glucosidase-like glycosyl hydrolase
VDDVPELDNIPTEVVDSDIHRQLALEAAEQGIVLLKNDGNLLPLAIDTKVALIGPHLNATQDMLSNYHGTNVLVDSNSPLQAFQRYNNGANLVGYEAVCSILDGCSTLPPTNVAHAQALATQADVAIIFIGLHPYRNDSNPAMESEAVDRLNLTLPAQQLELVQAILKVCLNCLD